MMWKKGSIYRNDESVEQSQPQTIIESVMKEKDSISTSSVNKIYFYSDVTKESIYILNRQLDEISRHLKNIQHTYELENPPPSKLYISSDGGEIFSAISTVDRIKNCDVPVYTYCEGMVASAATLISVSGHKRFINKNSCILIHQVSSGMWGTYMNFKDEIQNLDLLMKMVKEIYLTNTKFKESDLDSLLKRDIYLTAKECKKWGLVDEII